MPKWQWIIKNLGEKLWFRAGMFCLAGIITALLAVLFKDFIPVEYSNKIGADSVEDILDILASSMLAVTIFSLSTMVSAYTAASSNATPRATSLLLEDSTAQNALSVFIGSFLFSLVGIIALRVGVYGESGRLILFITTLAVIFIIIVVLLRWVDHLSRLGRLVETIDMVEAAVAKAIEQRLLKPYLGGVKLVNYSQSAAHFPIQHPDIGYIQNIDMYKLNNLIKEIDVDIYIQSLPGRFNDSSAAIAYCTRKLSDEELKTFKDAFVINGERSFEQDPRYGLIVLSEIASRALSPAINDQGTAIDIIGTAVRVLVPWIKHSSNNTEILFPRIYVPPLNLSDLFEDIFNPIARDGASKIEVITRLSKALASLSALGDEECKKVAWNCWNLAKQRANDSLDKNEKNILNSLNF